MLSFEFQTWIPKFPEELIGEKKRNSQKLEILVLNFQFQSFAINKQMNKNGS